MLRLPPHEVKFLNDTISSAIDLVEEGLFAKGYDLLPVGLGRARVREKRGDEWGEVLVHLWDNACAIFCASYGVSLEST